METKKQYIAPALTVVTFKVEQGYATSTGLQSTSKLDLFTLAYEDDYNAQAQENWHESGNLFDSWQ